MKTVKVKIGVAVDAKGRWYAHGQFGGETTFPENHDELLETVDVEHECGPHEALYWVTAELEIPEVKEVAGLTATPQ